MSSNQEIIARYEAIAQTSALMLAAAQGGEWQRFCDLESDCARLIQELRVRASCAELDKAEKRARMQALRRVLAHDAQIRCITEPEITRLGPFLGAPLPGLAGG